MEARLRDDHRIGVLVNNAGTAPAGGFVDQNPDEVARIVNLSAMGPVRLASAVAPRFAQAGQGAIVNIGSVIALAPEYSSTVYGATKAFIVFLSQSLHAELGPKGVYVQAVLPAATRTEIWKHAGKDVDKLPAVMEVIWVSQKSRGQHLRARRMHPMNTRKGQTPATLKLRPFIAAIYHCCARLPLPVER